MSLKISIGSDHAGYDLTMTIVKYLTENGIESIDFGTDNLNSCDYPDFAHAVIGSLIDGETDLSILICGSANGMCMTANKWRDVRAALCWTSEIASLARQHNNANVLCLPARFITEEEALLTLKTFIETEFEGGRHEKRVNKINPTF